MQDVKASGVVHPNPLDTGSAEQEAARQVEHRILAEVSTALCGAPTAWELDHIKAEITKLKQREIDAISQRNAVVGAAAQLLRWYDAAQKCWPAGKEADRRALEALIKPYT